MATVQEKQALMTKKIKDLTTEELKSLAVPVGVPGLPFPMSYITEDDKGRLTTNIGVIQSVQNPIVVYSALPAERIYGMMIREQSVPSMMKIERDLWAKLQPGSKNRFQAVMGDASAGKSHDSIKAAAIVHPKGAIRVDCGGMNMRELFFRTVIDYGKGVQEQLNEKASKTGLKASSVEKLNASFPGAVKVQDDGTAVINWDLIGMPKRVPDSDDNTKTVIAKDDDYQKATIRAKDILTSVYATEGINAQSNAFGIKTVKGEIIVSLETGQPIILDEFNKSKGGTLDAFQTFLEFAIGQKDSFKVYNPMATSDGSDESPKFFEFSRDDMRLSWFMRALGNDTADGSTTQDISYSMETRLNPDRVGEPALIDWEHRISQIMTGLPLTTLYTLFAKQAQADTAKFADWLVNMRRCGMTENEYKAIPSHEIYLLKNFVETVQAIKQLAKYYNDRLELSDPESERYNGKDTKLMDMADEVASDGRRIKVSFRKFIEEFNKAIQSTPDVVKASDATLELDLSVAFKAVSSTSINPNKEGWHKLGANLSRVMMEGVFNDTVGMEKTRAVLVETMKQCGITTPNLKEGKLSANFKLLKDLLKFDDLAELGGREELERVRGILVAFLKGANPTSKFGTDDEKIMPLQTLGTVMLDLKERQQIAKTFIVPNDNINSVTGAPLVEGLAMQNYVLGERKVITDPEVLKRYDEVVTDNKYVLADFRAALAAISLPVYGDVNRKRIWASDLMDYVVENTKPDKEEDIEAYNVLQGKSKISFDMTVIQAADGKGNETFMYLLEDRILKKAMIVGPEKISAQLEAELSKHNVSYVSRDDTRKVPVDEEVIDEKTGKEKTVKKEVPKTVQEINAFLAEGAKERVKSGQIKDGDTQSVIESMIKAFSALCQVDEAGDEKETRVSAGTTLGKTLYDNKSEPAIYTRILKPRR